MDEMSIRCVMMTEKWRCRPLAAAGHSGHLDIGRILLTHDTTPSEQAILATIDLHQAIISEQDAWVECLLDHGADLNVPSPDKCTPVETAAKYGRVVSVELLLSRGADVNLPDRSLGSSICAARMVEALSSPRHFKRRTFLL